jgi:hypothetical protein
MYSIIKHVITINRQHVVKMMFSCCIYCNQTSSMNKNHVNMKTKWLWKLGFDFIFKKYQ